jgi:integrase/recombinase XerC
VPSIAAVQPVHVACYIEELTRERSALTTNERLSGIRQRGKTPVLSPEEARRVLDAIDVSTHAGLRDRALIGLMVFSFARIGAALAMNVEDVFVQNRRLWVRLREKGGKR